MRRDLLDHGLALLESNWRLALWVAQARPPPPRRRGDWPADDLEGAVVERVERIREQTYLHELVPLRWATVTSVPPYRRSLAIIQSSGSAIGASDSRTATSAWRSDSRAGHPSKL